MDKIAALRGHISEEGDLLLFDEAVKCLKGKAYRAAYVMTWLSIAESIRNKLIEMKKRDSTIGRIFDELEQMEQGNRSTDQFLLDKANELRLLTPDELKKLTHIKEMRNSYAHPTGVAPSKEEVLVALTIAVDAVLSRPPLLRHGFIAILLKNLFDDRYFLDDVPEQIAEYAKNIAHLLHPEVLPYLLENLTKRLEPLINDPDLQVFRTRGLVFGVALLTELQPNLTEKAWDIVSIVQKYPTSSAFILSGPKVWSLLSRQCQDMVLGHLLAPISENKAQTPTSSGIRRSWLLSKANLLTKRQAERFSQAINDAPFSLLEGAGIPLKLYVERVLWGLKIRTWDSQNEACRALQTAGAEECTQVDTTQQEQLGRNVLQAAEGSARIPSHFIGGIEQSKQLWPRVFIEGLLLETLVNDAGQFRLKGKHFVSALKIAAAHPDVEVIIDCLCERVQQSRPKEKWTASSDYEQALELTSDISQELDATSCAFLDKVKEAINLAKQQMLDAEP